MTFHTNTADEVNGVVAPLPQVVSILTRSYNPGTPEYASVSELGRIVFDIDPDLDPEDERIQVTLKTARELADAFTKLGEQWTRIADYNEAAMEEHGA